MGPDRQHGCRGAPDDTSLPDLLVTPGHDGRGVPTRDCAEPTARMPVAVLLTERYGLATGPTCGRRDDLAALALDIMEGRCIALDRSRLRPPGQDGGRSRRADAGRRAELLRAAPAVWSSRL